MKKFFHIILFIFQYCFYYLITPLAYLLYKNKHPWIICERGDDARDNGYTMFKYLRHEQQYINVYYLIDKKSVDYPKVKSLGKVVRYKSFKHWLLYRVAECRMTTHLAAFAPGNYIGEWFKHHKQCGINVFLQHGITHNEFPSNYYEHNGSDLFICGAKPEYEHISKNCHYPEGNVVYTGFSRFDELHDYETKDQILVMPTWRSYLQGLSKEEFKQSKYFQAWDNLLRSKELNDKLEKENIKLIFYIHYSLQKYSDCFAGYGSNIVIADFDHYDVQTLLKESKLLITDYSSIFFDFAYMRKSSIYYQFDYDDFYGKHYKQSYFNHKDNGFGPVVDNNTILTKTINNSINNNFILEKEYEDRIISFFSIYDTNNSKRIFDNVTHKYIENLKTKPFSHKDRRPVIVFAGDDYARNKEASKGIELAFKNDFIQKSTMIVNKYDDSFFDKNFIKNNNIGLHLNLYDSDIPPSHKEEIKDLKHLEKICLSKKSFFWISKKNKELIHRYVKLQINTFTTISGSKIWDSHGHTHNKIPILKIMLPLLKESGFEEARLGQNIIVKHLLFDLTYKKTLNNLIRKNFQTCDYFGSVNDLFHINISKKKYKNKKIEIMTHPVIDNNGRLVNRRDYSFDLIKEYLEKYNY